MSSDPPTPPLEAANHVSIALPPMPTAIASITPIGNSLNRTLSQMKENLRVRQSLMQTATALHAAAQTKRVAPTKGWGTLPYDVLETIFAHLDRRYLVHYVTLVCKHWRRAVMCDRFIKHLYLTQSGTPLYYVYDFLRKYKHLASLHMNNVSNPLSILMQANKVSVALKSIALTNYHHIDGKVLSYITKQFPMLEGISLESSNIDSMNLSAEVMMLTHLKSLNLYNVKTIGLGKNAILEMVLNCRELEELNIGLFPPLMNLTDDDVVVILTNLAPKLKALTLDSRVLTMRSLEKVKDCKQLRKVYIKYAVNLTGNFLAEFWKQLWSVDELGFTHNCIINGLDINALFRNGAVCFASITTLDFTYCVLLSDVGVEAIADVCQRLEKAHFKSCRSLQNVEPLCARCARLRTLDISYCSQLRMNFNVPKQLEVLIVDERKKLMYYVEKYRSMKHLKIYVALSEFGENLELLA